VVVTDVSDWEQVRNLVQSAVDRFGCIDTWSTMLRLALSVSGGGTPRRNQPGDSGELDGPDLWNEGHPSPYEIPGGRHHH
jgi:hypothetical protein